MHAAAVAGGSLRVPFIFAGAAGVVWQWFPAGFVAGDGSVDCGVFVVVAGAAVVFVVAVGAVVFAGAGAGLCFDVAELTA